MQKRSKQKKAQETPPAAARARAFMASSLPR
jgi:hypothetical protein